MTITHKTHGSDEIDQTAQEMITEAHFYNDTVDATFNGVLLTVDAHSTVDSIVSYYYAEFKRAEEEYLASRQHAEDQRKQKE